MEYKQNAKLVPFAKSLRNNMTREEKHLWYDFLKLHPFRFQRQKVMGKYIVDFYCAQAQLVIELDGSQHFDPAEQARDTGRTQYLEGYGLKVIRVPNNAVTQNFQGVCAYIDAVLANPNVDIDPLG